MALTRRGGAALCATAISLALAALAGGAHGAASTGAPAAGDPGPGLRSRIDAARGRLLAHYADVDKRSMLADTLEARLDADESNLFAAGKPENVSAADFWDWNSAIVGLDENLVAQLASGATHLLSGVRGLDDVPLPMHEGGPLAPCAIDVPRSYTGGKPAPLVVLLHGNGVSEAVEIAEPLFRSLADETGAIVIAPFGRGDELRTPSGVKDVYAALDAVESTFNIDHSRVYLAGDSLGGYAAFDVAATRPSAWNAILAIRSTMDPADQERVKEQLRGKALYVVSGAADAVASVEDVRRSVTWFRSVGIATTYYEVPDAAHDLIALSPLVRRAWREMVSGMRSLQPPQAEIPDMTPPPSQKP